MDNARKSILIGAIFGIVAFFAALKFGITLSTIATEEVKFGLIVALIICPIYYFYKIFSEKDRDITGNEVAIIASIIALIIALLN